MCSRARWNYELSESVVSRVEFPPLRVGREPPPRGQQIEIRIKNRISAVSTLKCKRLLSARKSKEKEEEDEQIVD